MNFRGRPHEEPEINLIPFIDVLLVVLIFLMLSTTYSKFTEIQLQLPVADVDQQRERPKEIQVTITSNGTVGVNAQAVAGGGPEAIAEALRAAARAGSDSIVVINADASARHQSVVSVMEAARRAGLVRVTFATQPSGQVAPQPRR